MQDDTTDTSPPFSDSPARRRSSHHDTRADRPHHGHRSSRSGPDRVVALIDARFWWWLGDEGAQPGADTPADLPDTVERLLRRHASADLLRIYWYTDQAPEQRVPGVVPRLVPTNAQDGGVGMLRLMAHDLLQMAERRSADRILLVSDDERLLLAVDRAQHLGLAVDMLIDEQAQDERRLREDDPSWARLLQLAERLVVLGDAPAHPHRARAHGDGPRREQATGQREARVPPSPEAVELIESEITQWWGEESESQREHWRQEVQHSRGIPQELDRQLLLRVSRRLGQALSPAEKSAMRAGVRRRIAGDGESEAGPAGAAATSLPTDD